MLTKFYVHTRADQEGQHRVHAESFRILPALEERLYIGGFATGDQAVTAAKQYHPPVMQCPQCISPKSRY